jgi:hypothetical protein
MELQPYSRTLELPLSKPSQGAGWTGCVDGAPHSTGEAVRAAAAPPPDLLGSDLGKENGASAARLVCPVCGQSPDPRLMPSRVPFWLRRTWLAARFDGRSLRFL